MKRFLKIIVIFNLILNLLIPNLASISIAVDNMNSETTNVENVQFDAYFKEEQAQISNLATLVLSISVKNEGFFTDGKILIGNSNFKLQKDGIQNEMIREITDNEIILNTVQCGKDVNIEIPVYFNKKEVFVTDYFNQDNEINLEGKYQESSEKRQKEVKGSKNIKINWTEEAEIMFSQDVEKYKSMGESGVLLQQSIITGVKDNKLPREGETILTVAPKIANTNPNSVVVLLNGVKINANYNQENGIVEINNSKEANGENEVQWGNQYNIYKVIYKYPQAVGEENQTINLSTSVSTKLYTKETQTVQESIEKNIEKTGNQISLKKQFLNAIYKGYLYANNGKETRSRRKRHN